MKKVHCCFCGGWHKPTLALGGIPFVSCDKSPRDRLTLFKKCICPPESRTLPKEDGKNE